MAIKVSGTTVVDDSRNLTNIASVDATTVTAIGAAGVGGGGTHDFVASGAIANGDVVSLNSDGTVSVTAADGDPQTTGSRTTFSSSSISRTASVFDSANNKIVIAYLDETNSFYGTAVVGTVSGTAITFGTPVVFENTGSSWPSITYDSTSQKVVISYTIGATSGNAIVGTVSGNSISFGTTVVFQSGWLTQTSSRFDPTSGKVIIAYRNHSNSNYGTAVVGTVSGTSISFGTPVVFNSGTTTNTSICADTVNSKIVIAYSDNGNSGYGTAIVGTVSGTSISFGAESVFDNTTTVYSTSSVFDNTNGKVVISYRTSGGKSVVGTVSGTSISFGTPVTFSSALSDYLNAVYSPSNNKVFISFRYSESFIFKLGLIVGTVSGTTISFDSPTALVDLAPTDFITAWVTLAEDTTNNRLITSYEETGTGNGESIVTKPASTNASSYIGVAAEAISDTATGEITIIGGVNEQTVNSYDLSTASYDNVSFSVASQETFPLSLIFNNDGSKMYVLGFTSSIYQYSLSTAFDISTASYDSVSFSVASQDDAKGIVFNDQGTKMYMVGSVGDSVYQYSLSTAFDISTASYDSVSFSVASQDITPLDIAFNNDGSKMYILGDSNDSVYQYSLSTAFDLSTASYDSVSFSVGSQESSPYGIAFSANGNKMYVIGFSNDSVYQYSLSTEFNISTASYDNVSFSVASQETFPRDFVFNNDGTKMYVVGTTNDTVYQYTTGTFGGYTTNQSYFVADDGTLTTTNNGRKIGEALSATELQVKMKLTGGEMNEYLGGLV